MAELLAIGSIQHTPGCTQCKVPPWLEVNCKKNIKDATLLKQLLLKVLNIQVKTLCLFVWIYQWAVNCWSTRPQGDSNISSEHLIRSKFNQFDFPRIIVRIKWLWEKKFLFVKLKKNTSFTYNRSPKIQKRYYCVVLS